MYDNVVDLTEAVRKCWSSISVEKCRTLARSMRKRFIEFVTKNGNETNY